MIVKCLMFPLALALTAIVLACVLLALLVGVRGTAGEPQEL